MNTEHFLQLDRVIHEKGRMGIMSLLAATPELSFTEVRDTLQMTDGNLMSHVRTLQEAGYVVVSKSFQNNRPLTTLSDFDPETDAVVLDLGDLFSTSDLDVDAGGAPGCMADADDPECVVMLGAIGIGAMQHAFRVAPRGID